jgi:serine/threonine-protein kinase RsbW
MARSGSARVFELRNDPAEIERLAPELEDFGASYDLPPATIFAVNLALEEVITNIISYGFDDDSLEHLIGVELSVVDGAVLATIEDEGRFFDPAAAPAPDVDAPLEQRDVGGLGVLLVHKLMDEVTYFRDGSRNRLTLKKQINPAASPVDG